MTGRAAQDAVPDRADPPLAMPITQLRTEPEPVEVAGIRLKCHMCSHEAFHRRKTHFDTALFGGLNPEWSDSQGYCLICSKCGYIHWFMTPK